MRERLQADGEELLLPGVESDLGEVVGLTAKRSILFLGSSTSFTGRIAQLQWDHKLLSQVVLRSYISETAVLSPCAVLLTCTLRTKFEKNSICATNVTVL